MSRVIYDVTLSLEGALSLARERNESEVFICGGAEIYAQERGNRQFTPARFYNTGVPTSIYSLRYTVEF